MGTLVTPRLRLLYPLKDGYRISTPSEGALHGAGGPLHDPSSNSTWVADHLGLGARVEVTFGAPSGVFAAPRDVFIAPSGVVAPADAASAVPAELSPDDPSPDAIAFQQRARVTAQINDPHVVRILEQGSVDGLPFIVTEWLEGKSFRQRLLHGPASLAEVDTLLGQACPTLAKAHALGIAHGGLSPDCLYSIDVADQPFLRISGFGVSRSGASGEASAKNDYSSPEQLLLDARELDERDHARADLWALAVSVYELLTITLPFEASTAAGVTLAICNAQFAPPSHYRADLPRGIDSWFTRALAKDPAQRFVDAVDFGRAFVEAAALLSVPVVPAGVSVAAVPPAVAVPPPPMPIGPALDESLEMDDGEEDEKTVKWDAPSEWTGAPKVAPAAILPSVVLQPLSFPGSSGAPSGPGSPSRPGAAPKRVSVATPGVASARQGARTQQPNRASLDQVAIPPTLAPSAYMDAPYIASIASALAVRSAPLAAEASRARQRFFTDKTWIAGAAFAAGVAVTWFMYEPESDAESAEATADDDGIRTVRVDDLPQVPAGESADEEDLPVIIHTSQLPRATDETGERRELASVSPPPIERRNTPSASAPSPSASGRTASIQSVPVQKVQALSPAPATARPSSTPGPKTALAQANCTPPYYFDKQGIQRLKSECLDATTVTGPYGAVITSTASTKMAAQAASKPNDKQARANTSCSPPYYFDGKIRRIKVDCL